MLLFISIKWYLISVEMKPFARRPNIVSPEELSLACSVLQAGKERFIGEVFGHDELGLIRQLASVELEYFESLNDDELALQRETDKGMEMNPRAVELFNLELDLHGFISATAGEFHDYDLLMYQENYLRVGTTAEHAQGQPEKKLEAFARVGGVALRKTLVRLKPSSEKLLEVTPATVDELDVAAINHFVNRMHIARDELDRLVDQADSAEKLAQSIPRLN